MCKVSPTIKSMIAIEGVSRKDAAAALGISPQALSNKYNRDSFGAAELVQIANVCGYNLAFIRRVDGLAIPFPVPAAPATSQENKA